MVSINSPCSTENNFLLFLEFKKIFTLKGNLGDFEDIEVKCYLERPDLDLAVLRGREENVGDWLEPDVRDVAGVRGLDHRVLLHRVEVEPSGSGLFVITEPEEPESRADPQHYPASPGLGVHEEPAGGDLPHVPGHRHSRGHFPSLQSSNTPEDDAVPAAADQLVLGVPAEIPHGDLGLVTREGRQGGGGVVSGPEVREGGGSVD